MKPKMMSVADFCEYVGVKKTTAYKLIKEGKIEVARIGRRTLISLDSINHLIERCTSQNGSA